MSQYSQVSHFYDFPGRIILTTSFLTVSDTASKEQTADKSGPLIKQLLEDSSNSDFVCVATKIVPDDESMIRDVIVHWCKDSLADWIITTGGTGFGSRDRTPEVSLFFIHLILFDVQFTYPNKI